MKPKIIVILILLVFAVIIAVQNSQMVEIQIFFWKIAMSRIIMIAFLLFLGFVIGYFASRIQKK